MFGCASSPSEVWEKSRKASCPWLSCFYKTSEANPKLLMMCGMSKSSGIFSWHWKTMKETQPSSVSDVMITAALKNGVEEFSWCLCLQGLVLKLQKFGG
jgi:hypothetical protein